MRSQCVTQDFLFHTILSFHVTLLVFQYQDILYYMAFGLVFFLRLLLGKRMSLLSSAAVSILYYRSSSYSYVHILNSKSSPSDFAQWFP